MEKNGKYLEIMDTTLRDGEQTPGVSFTVIEKLEIVKMLILQLKVDRIELTSARVSSGESEAVRQILSWAKSKDCLKRMEILGFVDGGKSTDWIVAHGGKVINLLAKGSEHHCRIQLRKTPQQHYKDVVREVKNAIERGLEVNVYLEDWSNGMRYSPDYVLDLTRVLLELPVRRIMLPDTLGILDPYDISRYIGQMYKYFPDGVFDFHGHNDYGLVTANSLAAANCGVNGVHTTINGLGERAGNQDLSSFVVALHDHSCRSTNVQEKHLQRASELVQVFSGKRCAWNTPVVGSDVFTQTCGVHADGDKKGNLYANLILPERFGRRRNYALGKLAGKASIEKNLEELNIKLDDDIRRKILQEVVRLGDKKKTVTQADLPFIIASVLNTPISGRVKIVDYVITTRAGKLSKAELTLDFDGEKASSESSGNGGFDAFVKALRKLMKSFKITLPRLVDYEVHIPPGGKTDALVETTITWERGKEKPLVTTGVDSDQVAAAILATEKMLNLVVK